MAFNKNPLQAGNDIDIIDYSQDLENRVEEGFDELIDVANDYENFKNDVADYVVEYGSNANGDWEKWQSGKLIQKGLVVRQVTTDDVVGSIYYGVTGKIDFPIPFLDTSYSIDPTLETLTGLNWPGVDNNGCEIDGVRLRVFGAINLTRDYKVRWYAVGRWK